jgi:hypothetical protein
MSQVAISGNASGTGTLTIAAPNTNSNYTLTLPQNTGTLISTKSAGTVLQVVQGIKTDTFVTSATVTDTAVTGLTASITPTSSTSKILVMIELALSAENAQGGAAKVTRGGTVISAALPTSYSSRSPTSFSGSAYRGSVGNYTAIAWGVSMNYLDSPATTSSITYGVVVSSLSTGTYVNRAGADADSSDSSRMVSSITLMEIAA